MDGNLCIRGLGTAILLLLCSSTDGVPVRLSPISSSDFSALPESVDVDYGFDYLHLVQEWPGSFCDGRRGCVWPKIPPTEGGFLLHGLWPEWLNGSWPEYCDPSSPFNSTAIIELLPLMHKFWPSLVSPDQASFWAHEWNRHGACCETLTPTETPYFSLVLRLRASFDAAAILARAGIIPAHPPSADARAASPSRTGRATQAVDAHEHAAEDVEPRRKGEGKNGEEEEEEEPQQQQQQQQGVAGMTSWRAVKDALDAGFGNMVEVGCSKDKDGKLQLAEVRACFKPATTETEAAAAAAAAAAAVEGSVHMAQGVEGDGRERVLGGGDVVRIDCRKESDFRSCVSPDTPILFPPFHAASVDV